MSRIPPDQRPSARQLAAQSAGEPMQIGGKPADVCPYCGCGMYANGKRQGESMEFRYVWCRNKKCGRKFYSKQPPATLVREIGVDDIPSSSGRNNLTLHKESA